MAEVPTEVVKVHISYITSRMADGQQYRAQLWGNYHQSGYRQCFPKATVIVDTIVTGKGHAQIVRKQTSHYK